MWDPEGERWQRPAPELSDSPQLVEGRYQSMALMLSEAADWQG